MIDIPFRDPVIANSTAGTKSIGKGIDKEHHPICLDSIFSARNVEYVALLLVVMVSASYAYATWANTTLYIDEQVYARAGYSLAQGHLASASSLLRIYREFGFVANNIHTPFGYVDSVEPWLDHPPLVPLLLVPLLAIDASPRLLPIIFSSVSPLLIFFLFRNRRVLAWSSTLVWTGLFVTHPILSMLFVDSGVAFFNLLTVTLLSQYTRTHTKQWLYFAAVAAGASALSKEIFGFTSILYLLVYLVYVRLGPRRELLTRNLKPFLLAVGIALTWWIFAMTVAAQLFIQIFQFNVLRSTFSSHTFSDIFRIFLASFSYSKRSMSYTGIDSVLVISWVALIYSLSKPGVRTVQVSSLCYLSIVFALRYVWFFTVIPLFPFFAIGIGTIVTDLISTLRSPTWTSHFRLRKQLREMSRVVNLVFFAGERWRTRCKSAQPATQFRVCLGRN